MTSPSALQFPTTTVAWNLFTSTELSWKSLAVKVGFFVLPIFVLIDLVTSAIRAIRGVERKEGVGKLKTRQFAGIQMEYLSEIDSLLLKPANTPDGKRRVLHIWQLQKLPPGLTNGKMLEASYRSDSSSEEGEEKAYRCQIRVVDFKGTQDLGLLEPVIQKMVEEFRALSVNGIQPEWEALVLCCVGASWLHSEVIHAHLHTRMEQEYAAFQSESGIAEESSDLRMSPIKSRIATPEDDLRSPALLPGLFQTPTKGREPSSPVPNSGRSPARLVETPGHLPPPSLVVSPPSARSSSALD